MENNNQKPLISIAPMLDITNVHFRHFMRLLTTHSTLYTQMIHQNAILLNEKGHDNAIKFNKNEHPVVLQVGGSDPEGLAGCAKIAQQLGYDEINLNVGCPSPRVQKGSFGACLMKQPKLVAECMQAMTKATSIPCTVKCRLGVDKFDSYDFTKDFVKTVSQFGNVRHFIIHSRIALLKGLNPSENRNVPPLKYEYVYQLQKDFPELKFTINGGIKTLEHAKQFLVDRGLHGVMIGRTAYENPWELRATDPLIYNKISENYSRREILLKYTDYADKVLEEQPTIARRVLIKPILNLFNGLENNAKYRQFFSEPKRMQSYETFSDIMHSAIEIAEECSEQIKTGLEERKFDKVKPSKLQSLLVEPGSKKD